MNRESRSRQSTSRARNRINVLASLASLVALVIAGLLSGCGRHSSGQTPANDPATPPNNAASTPFVLKATSYFQITTDSSGVHILSAPGSLVPISVVNSPSAAMTINTSAFVVPAISNAVLDFGAIKISALKDNNLQVCGASGKSQCTNAVIRMYTQGVAGDGLYNSAGGYGMPITAKFGANPALPVGLTAANAANVQIFAIPAKQHVLHLTDFIPTPNFEIFSDFTNAGAGSYSTTLVVEYGLN